MNSQLDDNFERQFFTYVLDAVVPAASVQDPFQLQILSDADFEWWWSLVSVTPRTTFPYLKMLMKEQATGRDFIQTTAAQQSNAAFNGINVDNWAGTAQASAAFPLAVPYIMPATRVYSFLLTEANGGNQTTAEICLSGFKLWPRPTVS